MELSHRRLKSAWTPGLKRYIHHHAPYETQFQVMYLCKSPYPSLCLLLATVFTTLGLDVAVAQDGTSANRIGGDLFTKISMSPTAEASPSGKRENSIVGEISLSRLLSGDGITNEIESQSVRVQLNALIKDAPQDRYLLLSVDAESERIDARLPLDAKTIQALRPTDRLVQAMVVLGRMPNTHLIAVDKTLSLHTSRRSSDVTTLDVRTLAQRLWTGREKLVALKGQPATRQSSKQATKPVNLVGTWSAKTSAEQAWAVRFASDRSFTLVHTQGSKNSVSSGNYEVAGSKLTLRGANGINLSGIIHVKQKSFQWNLETADGKPALTLAFSKQ